METVPLACKCRTPKVWDVLREIANSSKNSCGQFRGKPLQETEIPLDLYWNARVNCALGFPMPHFGAFPKDYFNKNPSNAAHRNVSEFPLYVRQAEHENESKKLLEDVDELGCRSWRIE